MKKQSNPPPPIEGRPAPPPAPPRVDDPRKPLSADEVEELLKATLHGPLPQLMVYRMMATLAEWLGNGERPPSSNRDRQVSTATRLQLIEVVKEWRESGQSDMQLLFRLKTTPIKLPTKMVVAKHCTCDDPGEGQCPAHGRENQLQDQLIEARREIEHWQAEYRKLAEGSCQSCDDHGPTCECGHPDHIHPNRPQMGYDGACLACGCKVFKAKE